jgi:hypothetical protein
VPGAHLNSSASRRDSAGSKNARSYSRSLGAFSLGFRVVPEEMSA